jgi:predicted glycosyltransferase
MFLAAEASSLHRRTFCARFRNLLTWSMATIWIDLDNTPHVPFFKPIIRELENRGHQVLLTARDAFQVCELAQQMGLACRKIGRHYGKNLLRKLLGWILRALQLTPIVLQNRPRLALSHGARSQILLANALGIPTVAVDDYEHSRWPPFARPRWLILPEAISAESVSGISGHVRHYSGMKEDVYAYEFTPDASILSLLKLDGDYIIVTIRPPATEAHYHNPESEKLLVHFMNRLCGTPAAKAVLLPRNKQQKVDLLNRWPQWFENQKVIIPEVAVDGLNLLWHSDLAVSGGGTMNREAAALGVPVYSIFRGKIGAVDYELEKNGRLILIKSVDEVDQKIQLKRRAKDVLPDSTARKALPEIIAHLEHIIGQCQAV